MKVRYEAIDGKLYDTAADCQEHELECGRSYLQMFDGNGVLTEEPESAYFVWIDPKGRTDEVGGSLGALAFMSITNKEEYAGIDNESVGWHLWNSFDERYIWIDDLTMDALHRLPLNSSKCIDANDLEW